MGAWWALVMLVGMAWGQEAPSPDDAPPQASEAPEQDATDDVDPEDDGYEEVVVYSELLVREARQALVERAAQQGYTQVIERDDKTILRHVATYRGEVVLYDDGRVKIRRQPIQFKAPGDEKKVGNWLWCALLVPCIRPSGQTVSKRRYATYKREAMDAITPQLAEFESRLADYGLSQKIEALPDQMMALWEEGEPLESGPKLQTIDERKAALLQYWDTRTETAWGDRVRATIESFLRGVVQTSETPLTKEELYRFNANRRSLRPLGLPLEEALEEAEEQP